jgi:YVTN family beta-propeller protein
MKIKISVLLFFLALIGCKQDSPIIDADGSGYPNEIAKIILTRCATPGCHNENSKGAAGNLSLETWEAMFLGSKTGTVTVPYNYRQSPLFLFTNTFSDLGVGMEPTMPVNQDPLSKAEVLKLRNWIEAGAPNQQGFVKFSDNLNRKKIYITNQGCDLVAVVDKETNLLMRYIEVGNKPSIESPHMVKVAPDKKSWLVCFSAGSIMQKFRTSDDAFMGEVNIGFANWNTMAFTSDSKIAFVVDWSGNGKIAVVDIEKMQLVKNYSGNNLFSYPHGSVVSPDDKFLYVTSEKGNFIYKIDIRNLDFPEVEAISLIPGTNPGASPGLDPHYIEFTPDGTKYHVVCQGSNEIRVMDATNDQLLAVIPTGYYPQEVAFSKIKPYAFVSCMEDVFTFPGKRGSVSVYNYQTNTFLKAIYSGHQPHGLAIDDQTKRVYVANRNIDSGGPSPHHTTDCGGRNGYMTIINLDFLDLESPKKYELSVDPYFIDIRH